MATGGGEHLHIIDQLQSTVQSIIRQIGGDNSYAKRLVDKIHALQEKVESLSGQERIEFLHNAKDTLRNTIEHAEQKLMQYTNFQQVYTYSIVAAVIFTVLLVIALFGYKLYKSLMEKELKKQEKLKTKQAKKLKKTN
ncbi:uncharacterized protein LOC129244603 isoform X2 [Anastrepha obliqua]|uniref:uncharacterized protein LOC128868892 isoform X2 n=1 Tax=Anastrepha ludens TaxID=28586 RepID=UPI0023AFF6A8|nr:uncharacterized protein LOC128868892 isoform X2 [Anastrepha ludens]XP_054738301.1 uncharacterized protein LOC129244603 isoform X2 [Anastrepha obliqua]